MLFLPNSVYTCAKVLFVKLTLNQQYLIIESMGSGYRIFIYLPTKFFIFFKCWHHWPLFIHYTFFYMLFNDITSFISNAHTYIPGRALFCFFVSKFLFFARQGRSLKK